jgi:DNA-binding transcriptional ArsR family regulator
MSWHLRILRRAGLVTTTRAGRQVHCSVNHSVMEEYGSLLASYLESDLEPDGTPVGVRAGPSRQ